MLGLLDQAGTVSAMGGCGVDSTVNPILPQSNPACEALSSCCSSIEDATDSALCGFVQGLHFSDRCEDTLAYFVSIGDCAGVAFDAGRWSGLPPYVQSATEVTSESSANSFSHSSGH